VVVHNSFIGIKNKRVRMVADELQLLPPAFVFAVSNLDKNPDLKVVGLGNPKETTDALGVFCEPSTELGGWDGGIDQAPVTKTWKTRRPDGIVLQLVGTDSPNLDGKLGIPLITQQAIDRDVAQYGKDSLQFTMMNMGMMPHGQGSRRVLTTQLCRKSRALEKPMWSGHPVTKIGFLDAAYSGVGGDRCIFGELQIGYESESLDSSEVIFNVLSQESTPPKHRQIMALIDTVNVPVSVLKGADEPCDQIVSFVHGQCSTRGIAPENFFFDSGMRTALVTAFSRQWSPNVNPIDCGGAPTERPVGKGFTVRDRMSGKERPKRCNEHYQKFITEMWFSVRYIIEAGQFRWLREPVMAEGCQREWKIVGQNKIEVETKKEMKEKTGRSPDLFDALAVGVEGARRLGFRIMMETAEEEPDAPSQGWKRKLLDKKSIWRVGELVEV